MSAGEGNRVLRFLKCDGQKYKHLHLDENTCISVIGIYFKVPQSICYFSTKISLQNIFVWDKDEIITSLFHLYSEKNK